MITITFFLVLASLAYSAITDFRQAGEAARSLTIRA